MPKLKNHHQFWNREAKGLGLDKKNLHCGRYQEALLFPLSDIFPKLFFLKELNESWSELFHVLWDENSAKKWNQNLDHKKLEILLKSSWDYLDHHEKEAVFIFRMRTFFKEMKNDEIGLKKIRGETVNTVFVPGMCRNVRKCVGMYANVQECAEN